MKIIQFFRLSNFVYDTCMISQRTYMNFVWREEIIQIVYNLVGFLRILYDRVKNQRMCYQR